MCSSLRNPTKECCFKVTECAYHYLLISRKDMKSYRMSVYQCVPIGRKIVLKLLNVYVTACLFHGKFYESCRTWKSLRTLTKASCIKVAECVYHCVVNHGKLCKVAECVCISLRPYTVESCFKVAGCVYHCVLIERKVV